MCTTPSCWRGQEVPSGMERPTAYRILAAPPTAYHTIRPEATIKKAAPGVTSTKDGSAYVYNPTNHYESRITMGQIKAHPQRSFIVS